MAKSSKVRLLLSNSAWKAIVLDAYTRQQIEACGALLGRVDGEGNRVVEEVVPLRNTYASAVYFEFDPADLLTIDLEQPGRMIGVYHSHPGGPALASSTDRENMHRVNVEEQIPWVWLIISGPFSSQGAENESTISFRGVVAYYHSPTEGLQQLSIEYVADTESGPSSCD